MKIAKKAAPVAGMQNTVKHTVFQWYNIHKYHKIYGTCNI